MSWKEVEVLARQQQTTVVYLNLFSKDAIEEMAKRLGREHLD